MASGKKTGGRVKGTPNKVSTQIKEMINDFVACNIEDLQTTYNQLDAKEKLAFLERLLKFVIPTQNQSEININSLSESDLDALIERITNNLK